MCNKQELLQMEQIQFFFIFIAVLISIPTTKDP